MFDLLGAAQAYEMLHNPEIGKNLDTEGFLSLCLRAGYSQEVAEKSANAWANRRLDAGHEV